MCLVTVYGTGAIVDADVAVVLIADSCLFNMRDKRRGVTT